MVPVNYLAILVAAILNMVIGFLWYGPVFGKQWIKLSGFTEASLAEAKARGAMGKTYALAFIGSLLLAFVLAHSLVFAMSYLKVTGASAALQGAFWNWLGYIVPVLLGSVLWEGKSWKLWSLNVGYYLVSFLVMSLVLGLWR